MPLQSGEKLGPYEILAPIGADGMGEVYKATDTRLDRIVALKTNSTSVSSARPAPSPRSIIPTSATCTTSDPTIW